MSAPKRRKITKKKSTRNEDNDLNTFKEAVVMLFSKEQFGKSLGRRSRWNRMMNAGKVANWTNMSAQERIKEIGGDLRDHYTLDKLLKLVKFTKLKELYKTHFPKEIQKGRLSKVTLIQEIKNRYFGRTGDLEKRSIEQENVEELEDYEEQYQFITLCNFLIPADILEKILSYLKYDRDLLCSVGRSSKMIYLTILRSWPRIEVRKKNLYKISILVLRSVREVTFVIPKDSPTETFIKSEIEYALKNFNPNRIRKVNIICMIDPYVKILRFFRQLIRKKNFPNSNVFQKVTSFNVFTRNRVKPHPWNFGSTSRIRKSDFTVLCKNKWFGIPSLHDIFPNLQSAGGILNFRLLKGLESTLTTLLIDLTIPFTYEEHNNRFAPHNKLRARNRMWLKYKFDEKVNEIIGYIGTKKRDEGIPKRNIRSLTVIFNTEDQERVKTHLPNFLSSNKFENIRFLKLDCRVSDSRISWQVSNKHPTNAFDFSRFTSTTISNTLGKLILSDNRLTKYRWWSRLCESQGIHITTKKHSNLWKFPRTGLDGFGLSTIFPNLKVLKIYSQYFRLSDFVYCLSSGKVEEVDLCTRISFPVDAEDRNSHVLLMERLSSRLFQFRKAKLLLMFSEGKNFGNINLTVDFEKRKHNPSGNHDEPSCRIDLSFIKSKDRYGLCYMFDRKIDVKGVPLSDYPLLKLFLDEFPGIILSNKVFARFEDNMIEYFEKGNFNEDIPEIVNHERDDGCCISIFNNSFLDLDGSENYTILLGEYHQKEKKGAEKKETRNPYRVYFYALEE